MYDRWLLQVWGCFDGVILWVDLIVLVCDFAFGFLDLTIMIAFILG